MPREKLLNKLEPDRIYIPIRNAEASAAIVLGTPVAFVGNATNDGLDVVLPVTATAVKLSNLFAGVSKGLSNGQNNGTQSITFGRRGLAQVFGICSSAVLILSTRAATTDVWASQAAYAVGDSLVGNTVAAGFSLNAVGAASAFLPYAINVGFTQASVTTTGSSAYSATFSAATAYTTYSKIFLRAM